MLVSPGLYSLPAGLIALIAVASPRSAPEWFGVLLLAFGALGLVAALWGAAALVFTLRAYRSERISFDAVARSMALAARAFFRSGQLAAIAGALGLATLLALVFPGLASLAAFLTPGLALALAALPGVVRVPRHADAALALVVPSRSLPHGSDATESFRIGWRFEARMGAVRVAMADRGAALPEEARDIAKAVDGGGLIRPPIARLHLDLLGALWLRLRGLEAILVVALPVALLVWIVAALLPPGALPSLPRPGDLWPITESSDPASTDAEPEEAVDHSGHTSDSGPDGASDGESASGHTEGEAGGSGADAAEAGSDGAEDAGDGRGSADNGLAGATGDVGTSGTADGPGEDGPGAEGRGNNGHPADGGNPNTGGGGQGSGEGESDKAGDRASGGNVEAASDGDADGDSASDDTADGGAESGEVSDGGSESDNGTEGGDGPGDSSDTGEGDVVTSTANGQGDDTGSAGPEQGMPEPEDPAAAPGHAGTADTGGDLDGSGPAGSDAGEPGGGTDAQQEDMAAETAPDDGREQGQEVLEVTPGTTAPSDSPTEEIGLPLQGHAGDEEDIGPVADTGRGAEDAGGTPFSPEPEGGETLPVSKLRSLFAEPGEAPPAIVEELSPEAASDLPPGPEMPPRQRLPAWIADLLQ